MLEAYFRAIVSGERRGIGAAVSRGLLGCLEAPYRAAVSLRNRGYDRNPHRVHSVAAPVISVGNLTLGGTGKTPMVKWIAQQLTDRNQRVVLISRGYGGKGSEKNDEAKELEQALPEVPHLQNPDRVAAAKQALVDYNTDVLLLDDAFQHRRIARDLDIVLLDATAPFGFGRVFPRGLLREPVMELRRADVVCLTRANLISETQRQAIWREAEHYAPNAIWCEASHEPTRLLSTAGESQPVDSLAGKRVAAFCGIGNPDAFRSTLETTGCEIVDWSAFPDHHRYTHADIVGISERADALDAERIVCTHKDLVKIDEAPTSGVPLHAVVVDMQLTTGEEALKQQIERVLKPAGG